MKASARLRQLLKEPGIIVAPGCYDPLTARFIQHMGFQCAYLSGASTVIANLAMPDLGIITMTEMVTIARNVANAVEIPVIADMDTGFGSALNIRRAVREFESAGLAAVHIEDQPMAKRCGHFAGKSVVSTEEMVQRVRAAVEARRDPDFVIIARTDAIAVEGLESAIERGRRYAEAGAEVLYMEAPRTIEEIRALPPALPIPVLIGQPDQGLSPLVPTRELEAMGVKVAIYPSSIRLMMMGAAFEVLEELKKTGTSKRLLSRMGDNELLQAMIGVPEAFELLDRYAVQE
ncbi:MAG: oxaloacetate decarboxylase [candidate division NC10 bacterium]|nr:oxaloacetate decarboxylase [candidate division NC10 bacterium]